MRRISIVVIKKGVPIGSPYSFYPTDNFSSNKTTQRTTYISILSVK